MRDGRTHPAQGAQLLRDEKLKKEFVAEGTRCVLSIKLLEWISGLVCRVILD